MKRLLCLLVFSACAPDSDVHIDAAAPLATKTSADPLTLKRMPQAPSWYPVYARIEILAGSSADDLWAAGDDGTLLHYDGTSWDFSAPGIGNRKLVALSAASSKAAFAIDETAVIYAFNGAAWHPLFASVPAADTACIVAANERRFFVYEASTQVGASVYDYEDGSSGWTRRALGGFYAGPNNVWSNDTIDRCSILLRPDAHLLISGHPVKTWDQTSWVSLATADHKLRTSLSVTPAGETFALTNDRVERFDGHTWIDISPPSAWGHWRALGSRDAQTVVLAGDDGQARGVLALWNGTTWTKIVLPVNTPSLASLWIGENGEVVVGGEHGVILSGALP